MRNYYEVLKIEPNAALEEIIKSLELERSLCNQLTHISRQEIDLIIKQLEEVENTLLDPIRRSEYNRKLQKEQRNKIYKEQIAKEQEELQSFVDNNGSKIQSTEISIPESDKETEIKLSDRIIKEEVSSNIQEQLQQPIAIAKQNQISVTSPTQREPTHSTNSGLKDWQKSILTGSVIGIFVLLGFIFFKPNTPSQQVAQTSTETSTKTLSQTLNIDAQQVNREVSPTSTSFTQNNTQVRESEQSSSKPKIVTNNYPVDSCGDKDPGKVSTWYPVYVNATEENLSKIHSHYCRDAFLKYRKEVGIESIQVASFIDRTKAEAFAELIRQNFEVSEVGKPYVYGLNNPSVNYSSEDSSLNENHEEIDENASIALIERLYDLLSQKSFEEARSLYNPQFSYQFNSDFFNKFEKVTVNNLRIPSKTKDSIDFVGNNTYVWLDGSTQRELRSYTVSNLDGELKITASKFIKVTKSR